MTLKELGIGQSARILTVGGEGALRQHFLDMGVIPKAEVTVIKFAPMGDPMELQVHGYELTLRLDDAAQIEVELIDSRSRKHEGPKKISNTAHPGLGDRELILDTLRKKGYTQESLAEIDFSVKKSLISMLLRRGFEYEEICSIFKYMS